MVGSNTADADCPDARRFAFVAGFAPAYQTCHYAEPEENGGWRSWFGWGDRDEAAEAAQPQQQPEQP